jgi:hypothetical protein
MRQLGQFDVAVMNTGRGADEQEQGVSLSWRCCDDHDALQARMFPFAPTDLDVAAHRLRGVQHILEGVTAIGAKRLSWCHWPHASENLAFLEPLLLRSSTFVFS